MKACSSKAHAPAVAGERQEAVARCLAQGIHSQIPCVEVGVVEEGPQRVWT